KAAYWDARCAELGMVACIMNLAQIDPSQSGRLFLKAANTGDPYSQVLYGSMLINGANVPANPAEGARWIQKAAASPDYPYAKYQLAIVYMDGLGVPKDEAKAVDLLKRAAETANLAEPQSWLATLYREGRHVPKDPQEARRLYEL